MRRWICGIALAACGGNNHVTPDAAPPPDADQSGLICGEPPRGPAFNGLVNVTATSGIAFQYVSPDFRGGGLAAADLDGDGLPDVIAGQRAGGIALWHNLGGLKFAPIDPASIGLDPTIALSAVAAVDLDNDGDIDLVLAGPGTAFIMTNQGNGTFALAAMLPNSGTTEQVLAVDLDGDGLLDLFFANRDYPVGQTSENQLYMNKGDMAFTLVGTVPPYGLAWTATAFDYDGDGDQDIYIANDTLVDTYGPTVPQEQSPLPPDSFLRNDGVDGNGVPILTNIAPTFDPVLTAPRSSMDGALGDLDGDGQLDIFVTNIGLKPAFVRAGSGFVDRADELGLSAGFRTGDVNVAEACPDTTTHEDCLVVSWSAALTDFDLDGVDDLLVVDGTRTGLEPPPSMMFMRGTDPTYHEVALDIGCPDGRGLVVTDLDGDGDQDALIAPSRGGLIVLENTAIQSATPSATSWLDVRLQGGKSNRGGVGALVTATMASGRTLVKPVGAGGVLNSSTPPEAYFGLGSDTVVTLAVTWPSGRHSSLAGPLSGVVRVVEP